jgi:hypothetical protein
MGNFIQIAKRISLTLFMVVFLGLPVISSKIVEAAPVYSSNSYGVDEVFMGAGGTNDANSASYKARASLGDTGVGNSQSANFQAYGGFTTTDLPFLEFAVSAVNQDLGELIPGTPKSLTASFSVRTYLASGYSVVSNSDPPKNGTYTLKNLLVPTAYSSGVEQFGINLVNNNIAGLGSFGAIPVQVPDSSISFGYAAPGYDTTNQFKYVKGDVIAKSDKSSGTTNYTVSYLYSTADVTPGGEYRFIHDLVVTSKF